MNSVIVFVPRAVRLDDLAVVLSEIGLIERTPDGGFAVLGSNRLYVQHVDDLETYYEPDELEFVANLLGEYSAYTLDYSDIGTVKDAIARVETQWPSVIDNDHGLITPGREFVERMRQDPDWEWRITRAT
jgi:hypothetical protein